jgi:peptidoglycan/xylan/chitin deacetylase (PgdA/CDA1 family)
MNILITLDYELFYTDNPSLEKCIINPTNELLKIVDPLGVKMVLFVDVGYLKCLEKYKNDYPNLRKDYELITKQMKDLCNKGHEVQLHIHPHWEDTTYDGKKWNFDLTRYRLSHFSEEETAQIVTEYTEILHRITGQKITAYRAGGWSAQPWEPIGKALKDNGVHLDSSVYPKGYYNSSEQWFDFRNVGFDKTSWKFSNDLTKEDSKGYFTEIAISAYKVMPFFFWNFALKRIFGIKKHSSISQDTASPSKKQIARLLLWPSNSVVSIDGFKASYLEKAFQFYKRKKLNDFVIIGHPKAFTPFSLLKFKEFINKENRHSKVVLFSNYSA